MAITPPPTVPRRFYASMPVIYIWYGATLAARFQFSEKDNQPVVHGPFKRPYALADDTPTEGGRIYSHQAGLFYRYRVEYQVWSERYCLERRNSSMAPQMTEIEIGMLDLYASEPDSYDILFYPHSDISGIGATNDANYRVLLRANDMDRPTIAQDRVTAVMEVESKLPVVDLATRLWV